MTSRTALVVAAAAVLAPAAGLHAQVQVDIHGGLWRENIDAAEQSYVAHFRSGGKLFGPLSHGISLVTTIHDSLGRRQAFYGLGYDLMLFRPARFGPYAVVGAAAGLSTDTATQRLAVQWTAGAGLEWKPLSFFGIGVEARYRLEDRGPEGFWNATDVRKGVSVTAGAIFRWRVKRSGRRPTAAPAAAQPQPATQPVVTPTRTPTALVPMSAPRLIPAPTSVSGPAASVVNTAISALGTPYRWGGTADNGFDCSGLVQWAYGQHGVPMPRMSREQAGSGSEVPPTVNALAPGDVLLFAAEPGGGVTHVGLYVGEGKFIHSGSNGVRISLLDHSDANGSYWLRRWVGARRIMR